MASPGQRRCADIDVARCKRKVLGVAVDFLTPEGFPSFALPTYSNLRLALPNRREIARRIQAAAPDAIHIATEGTIGASVRAYCLRHGLPFTTSYTTRFPGIHLGAIPDPRVLELRGAAALPLRRDRDHGLDRLADVGAAAARFPQSRHVDARRRHRAVRTASRHSARLPRPIFLTAGRVAVEKNLEAFLSLDLPGSKVVIGDGPQEAELKHRFPQTTFLGLRSGPELAGLMASADVFVFPSLTDTFGVVQLEALACGVPVAAFPVTGPKDVIGNNAIGALNEDLRVACLEALQMSREACRAFALTRSWETSARQFIDHANQVATARSPKRHATLPVQAPAQG